MQSASWTAMDQRCARRRAFVASVATREPAVRPAGPAELTQLQRMAGEGATVTQAACILKISRSTAYTALRQHATAATPP